MNIPSRSAFIAAAIFLMAPATTPQQGWAQTPAQIEYERQQREYRQQQERQRQEQQQQQQLMNENARRQQEESRRLNAPTGQSPTPGYQGATPQTGPRQAGAQANASAATAANPVPNRTIAVGSGFCDTSGDCGFTMPSRGPR